ncbi:PREDICTED: phosphopantothenoylcysteine decarboxylase [Nicrophorus vespilloides]|uniref:Phosphopantothenoylcysteine decarboxylase n=1 Tax=Nicrophorus vespilloides TaxID=110193 RepID=A0ABM1ME69_NICVS|nr:PREDICTED: phosphopantothenoylcysteine decarboxylase [Nicrophorus vespilloides]
MVKILLGCTGSVATIKVLNIIENLLNSVNDVEIKLIVTQNSMHFFNVHEVPKEVKVFKDEDEWSAWKQRGDPVVHIELGKWADLFLIAPLDANTLAKMANGLCDNLLTSTIRAWEMSKPLIFCPAMNTKMYNHPLTESQINILTNWGYYMVPVIEKTLICGDTGLGAMAEVATIVEYVKDIIHKSTK